MDNAREVDCNGKETGKTYTGLVKVLRTETQCVNGIIVDLNGNPILKDGKEQHCQLWIATANKWPTPLKAKNVVPVTNPVATQPPRFFSFTHRVDRLQRDRPGIRQGISYGCESNNTCVSSYALDALNAVLNESAPSVNAGLTQLHEHGYLSEHYNPVTESYDPLQTVYPVTHGVTNHQYVSGFERDGTATDYTDRYVVVLGNRREGLNTLTQTLDDAYGVPSTHIHYVKNPTPKAIQAAYQKIRQSASSAQKPPNVLVIIACEGNRLSERDVDANGDYLLFEFDPTGRQTAKQRQAQGTTDAELKRIHHRVLPHAEVCYINTSCNGERLFFD
ncbi:MAG: hypothetical protein U0003_05405 [Vampirovibrionales bacterium]